MKYLKLLSNNHIRIVLQMQQLQSRCASAGPNANSM